jgi:hypothetical protein
MNTETNRPAPRMPRVVRAAGLILCFAALVAAQQKQAVKNNAAPRPTAGSAPRMNNNAGAANRSMPQGNNRTMPNNMNQGVRPPVQNNGAQRNGTLQQNRNNQSQSNRNNQFQSNRNNQSQSNRNNQRQSGQNNQLQSKQNTHQQHDPKIERQPKTNPRIEPVKNTRNLAVRNNRTIRTAQGAEAKVRPDGSIRSINAHGMNITRGPNGARRIVADRPDHSRIVVNRAGHGFIQRPFGFHGARYSARTYYVHGGVHERFYRQYSYRGVELAAYAPVRFYPPAFYGWVYNPWPRPIVYNWGWASLPWFASFQVYIQPAPVYPSASLWLTDYLVSTSLADYYQEQVDAGVQAGAPDGTQPMTPEIKQEIADEVQRQIALENYESQNQNKDTDPGSSGIARTLSDGNSHVFVASADLDVIDSSGTECSLTEGDALQLGMAPDSNALAAYVQVVWSKGDDCRKGTSVSVALEDLQEMQNHMREAIDQGLADLRSHEGQGGIPNAPPAASGAPANAAFASSAPPLDPNAASEINQQVQAANNAEQEVAGQTKL